MTLEEAVESATLGVYVELPRDTKVRYGTHFDFPYAEAVLAGIVKDRTGVHCFTSVDNIPEMHSVLVNVTPYLTAQIDQVLANDEFYYVETGDL